MASVNFLKCKAGSGNEAGALMRHCDRDERLRHDHANVHIDKMVTPFNLQMDSYRQSMEHLKSRLRTLDSTTNRNKRRDRVECFVLESVVPEGMTELRFCETMLQEIAQQYGSENVVAWYLHWDEVHEYMDHGEIKVSRPHVHVFVVPEREGQLNGKWFSSRANMRRLNRAIDARCKALGVSYMTGEHPRQRSVEELKLLSYDEAACAAKLAKEDLRSSMGELERARSALSEASHELSEARRSVLALDAEKSALKAEKAVLERQRAAIAGEITEIDAALVLSREKAAARQPKKRLFGESIVEVPLDEWTAVKQRAVLNTDLGTVQLREDALELKSMADAYSQRVHDQADRALIDAEEEARRIQRKADEYNRTVREKAEQTLSEARAEAQRIVSAAEEKVETLEERAASAQLREMRRDFPELERYFWGDTYQGRDYPERMAEDKVERSKHKHLVR